MSATKAFRFPLCLSISVLFVALTAAYAPASDFVAPKTFVTGDYANVMVVGDFNGDGKLDVAMVGKNLEILLGNGDGTFQAPAVYALINHSQAYSIAVGDFNHDGHPDLVVGTNDGIFTFMNDGSGAFAGTLNTAVGPSVQIFVGDINGDNKQDLLFAPYYEVETVYSILGNGDGTFQSATPIPLPGCPTGLTAGVFSTSGHIDIAVANAINCNNNDGYQISMLKGNGDGTFQPAVNYPTTDKYDLNPAVADFNKDGNLDLVVIVQGSNAINVFLGNGDGTLQPAKAFAVDIYPEDLIVADFNGDGNPDIAVVNGDNIAVLSGNGIGGFSRSYYEAGPNLYALAAGDFRGVGKPDLVTDVSSFTDGGELHYLVNQGGSFHAAHDYHASGGGYGIATADANGDGFNDIIAGEYIRNGFAQVAYFANNGKGIFKPATITNVPALRNSNPPYVATADFNKDGKLDVAVALRADDGAANVTILLGNGDGTFTVGPSYDIVLASLAAPLATADVDHDGNPDVVAICGAQICILLGNGDGTFQPPIAVNLGTSIYSPPTQFALADLNRDGKLDLVAIIGGTGNLVAVALGNGDGTFQAPTTFTDPKIPTALVLADFNGDGKVDLVLANQNTYFGVLLGNGDGTFQTEKHYNVGGSVLSAVVATDFNKDGKLDVGLIDSGFPCNLLVVHGNGDGTFNPPQAYPLPGNSIAAVATPLTPAGEQDLVIASQSEIAVYLNTRDF